MIEIRNHNEFALQASLKGIKIDFKKVKKQVEDFTDKQKAMMSEVIKQAAQRKLLEKAEKARSKSNGQRSK